MYRTLINLNPRVRENLTVLSFIDALILGITGPVAGVSQG